MTTYSYIICRRDMTTSYQAVQCAHAAMEMGFRTSCPKDPTHLIVLGIRDEKELMSIAEKLTQQGVPYELFYEPDYNTGYTALCTFPAEGKIRSLDKYDLL